MKQTLFILNDPPVRHRTQLQRASAGGARCCLGAGRGVIVAAQGVRSALPRSDRVVLIERAVEHVCPPSLLWLLVGKSQVPQISRYDRKNVGQ